MTRRYSLELWAMAFIRTALIILALLLGWTALRHQGVAGNPAPAPVAVTPR